VATEDFREALQLLRLPPFDLAIISALLPDDASALSRVK
jgi:hypothetical protein